EHANAKKVAEKAKEPETKAQKKVADKPMPPPANPKPDGTETPDRPLISEEEVQARMRSPVPSFAGFDDPKTSLDVALTHLSDRYDLYFSVNEAAFEAEQLLDVLAVRLAEKPV